VAKFKEYHQNQIMLMPPSLDEKIDRKHIARYISQVIDELNTDEIDKGYSDMGCSAYQPRMLLKLLIYGYSLGIRSSRRIQRESREDVVFMWLAGMQEPDFRTISNFRRDRIRDIKSLFKQVLETCHELGMVRCGRISIDGTKMEASSSRNKMTYRKALQRRKAKYEEEVQKILEEAEKIDEEEDRLYGDHDGYSMEKEFSAEEIKKALKKIAQDKSKNEHKGKKIQDRIDLINQKLDQMGNERNSFGNTDKDATLMLMKEGYFGVGYNVQVATENQVIIGYEVYQKANDIQLLVPMIEEVESNLGKTPQIVMADKGYCSHHNLEYIETRKIKAAIPPQSYDYDRSRLRKGTYKPTGNPSFEKLKLKMMDFLETEEGKNLMDKRKHDVEPAFADIKYNMGLRKFLLRTKPKVGVEIALISIAHNIKKMKKWMEAPNPGNILSTSYS
jgi:transposase